MRVSIICILDRIVEYKTAIYLALVYTKKRDLREARTLIQYLMYRSGILDQHPEVSNTNVEI